LHDIPLEITVRQVVNIRCRARGGCGGGRRPVDTHLHLVSEEPDEVNQRLLSMGARTCYLHAALGSALPTELDVTVD
jgi:hypothetical protein